MSTQNRDEKNVNRSFRFLLHER